MTEQETTHNFMGTSTGAVNVAGASIDSFSQLPFIRSTTSTRDKRPTNSSTGTSLRLFGFDFPKESSSYQTRDHQEENNSPVKDTKSDNNTSVSSASNETSAGRKFECHYCCRNFPTSQALGGHQNAHKRERQQAKRAQFQTSMTTEGQMYSPFTYYRLGSIPSSARFELAMMPPHYPSWVHGTSNLGPGPRFHGGLGSVSEPINGNPVSSTWRLPVHGAFGHGFSSMHHDRPMALPLLGGGDPKAMVSSSFSPATSSNNLVQERGVKDGVSLDLHL